MATFLFSFLLLAATPARAAELKACAAAVHAIKTQSRVTVSERGWKEVLSLAGLPAAFDRERRALEDMQIDFRPVFGQAAQYDPMTQRLTIGSQKAGLTRDFDGEILQACAGPKRAETVNALLGQRLERDIRLAGALIYEARRKIGLDEQAKSPEEAARKRQAAFYSELVRQIDRFELCEEFGEDRCRRGAVSVARDLNRSKEEKTL